LYVRDGHVARIAFNRPAALNAIDVNTARLFLAACRSIAADANVRVVVMEGAGRSFVVGGDLKVFRQDRSRIAKDLIDPMHEGLELLARSPAPLVAGLHGVVAGAGLSLALACDLAIAASGTRFNMAYLNVGASCDVGASWSLPRVVGLRKAMEIALLNPMLDAAEALRLGLVNRVVPTDELPSAVEEIVRRLAAGPPIATGHMKRLLRESCTRSLAGQLLAEREAFEACVATEDFTEALDAFVDKRAAHYEGR
jgi:2-(1,2-epoxy-1,2-dihydrophenyl)acetyl-CoA isomerase